MSAYCEAKVYAHEPFVIKGYSGSRPNALLVSSKHKLFFSSAQFDPMIDVEFYGIMSGAQIVENYDQKEIFRLFKMF